MVTGDPGRGAIDLRDFESQNPHKPGIHTMERPSALALVAFLTEGAETFFG